MKIIIAFLIGSFIGGLTYLLIRHLIWKNGIPKKIEELKWVGAILFCLLIITILVILRDLTSWGFLKDRETITGIGGGIVISIVSVLKSKSDVKNNL